MAISGHQRRQVEDEGESAFVSMTDLTVSFLFIILVLLAFFAAQFRPGDFVPRTEHEELEQERNELASRVSEADTAIAEQQALMDALQADLAKAMATIDELSGQVETLRLALLDAQEQLEGTVPRSDYQALESRLAEVEIIRGELVNQVADASRTLAERQALLDAVQADLTTARATIDELSGQMETLQLALLDAHEQLEGTVPRSEFEALERQLSEVEIIRGELINQVADANRTIAEQQAQLDALQGDLALAKRTIDEQSEQIASLLEEFQIENWIPRSDYEALETRLSEVESIRGELASQVADANRAIADQQALLGELQADLANAKSAIDELLGQIETLQLALLDIQEQIEGTVPRSDYEALETQLSEVEAIRRQLAEALAAERQRSEALEQERIALAEQVAEAGAAIAEQQAVLDTLRADLAVAERTIDEQSDQIESLLVEFQIENWIPRSKYDALERQLSEVEANRLQLAEALAVERQGSEALAEERNALAERVAEAESAIAEQQTLLGSLQAALSAAKTTIDELSRKVRNLQEAADEMQAQLEGTVPRSEFQSVERQLSEAMTVRRQLSAQNEALQHELEQIRKERDQLIERQSQEERPDTLAVYLADVSAARAALLERLGDRIRQAIPEVQLSVDTADGLIRFRADELFPPGSWRIQTGSLAERVSLAVGDAFAEVLPCYTLSPTNDIEVQCEGAIAAIETILIEGHTDDVGLGLELQRREQMRDNYDLSARRGAETLRVMTRDRPELLGHLNVRQQPVLSFAGYGETRPINPADSNEARAQNRRIDIRFILQTPRDLTEVEEIRSKLSRGRANLPDTLDEDRQ